VDKEQAETRQQLLSTSQMKHPRIHTTAPRCAPSFGVTAVLMVHTLDSPPPTRNVIKSRQRHGDLVLANAKTKATANYAAAPATFQAVE